jgi:hypothetical protein
MPNENRSLPLVQAPMTLDSYYTRIIPPVPQFPILRWKHEASSSSHALRSMDP